MTEDAKKARRRAKKPNVKTGLNNPELDIARFNSSFSGITDTSATPTDCGGANMCMGEGLNLKEDTLAVMKGSANKKIIELPTEIKLINHSIVEDFLDKLEPEQLFEVGYVTEVPLYKELDEILTLIKCTELIGYTGIDWIEARADGSDNTARVENAKQQISDLSNEDGVHGDQNPMGDAADFSANYTKVNKLSHGSQETIRKATQIDFKDGEGAKNTAQKILFYPQPGSTPKVRYYLKNLTNQNAQWVYCERETMLEVLLGIYTIIEGRHSKRWDRSKLERKINGMLEVDMATISTTVMDGTDNVEYRSKVGDTGYSVEKPKVRALYHNQIYLLDDGTETIGHTEF